jgi:hypothetical protein
VAIAAGGLAAAAIVAVAAVTLGGGDGDGGTAPTAAPATVAADPTTPATAAATVPATEPTSPPATEPPATLPPVCPSGDPRLCIEMTSVEESGDSLVIEWTPFNFEPGLDDFHAHFFWNTTRPEEAGTNAGDYGASPGDWELTASRPFVSEDVMRPSAKPPDATEVCVTAATHEHAVVDPTVFQCLPLP